MIALYHYPSSPCAAKVRAVLTEKAVPWDSRIVNIAEKENLRLDYLKLHPKGVVPALVDGDHTIIESTIIMEYLDTAYAPDSLKPKGAYAQAQMRKWTKWVDETLHPNWPGIAWNTLIRPTWLTKSQAEVDALLDKLIDPARRERQSRLLREGYSSPEFANSLRTLDRTLADMETALANQPWLVGDRPTLAESSAWVRRPCSASCARIFRSMRSSCMAHDSFARCQDRARLLRDPQDKRCTSPEPIA